MVFRRVGQSRCHSSSHQVRKGAGGDHGNFIPAALIGINRRETRGARESQEVRWAEIEGPLRVNYAELERTNDECAKLHSHGGSDQGVSRLMDDRYAGDDNDPLYPGLHAVGEGKTTLHAP